MSRKTELLSARVTPEFKSALRRAAAHERRSQSNLLEKIVFEYCEREGLMPISRPRRTLSSRSH